MDKDDKFKKQREELRDLLRQKAEMDEKLYNLETEIQTMEKDFLSKSTFLGHLFRGFGAPTDPRTGQPIEGGMFTLTSLTLMSRILQNISNKVEQQIEQNRDKEESESETENDNVNPVVSTIATAPLTKSPDVDETLKKSITQGSHSHSGPKAKSSPKKKHPQSYSKKHKHQDVTKKSTEIDLAFDALLESASYVNGKESKTAIDKARNELRENFKQHLQMLQHKQIKKSPKEQLAAQVSPKKRKYEENPKLCDLLGMTTTTLSHSSQQKVRQYVPKPKRPPPSEPPRPASWATQTYSKPGPSGINKSSIINKTSMAAITEAKTSNATKDATSEKDTRTKPVMIQPTENPFKSTIDLTKNEGSLLQTGTQSFKKATSTKSEAEHTFAVPKVASISNVTSDLSLNPVLHSTETNVFMAPEASELPVLHSPTTFTYRIPESELQMPQPGPATPLYTPGMVINMDEASSIHTLQEVPSTESQSTAPLSTTSAVDTAVSTEEENQNIDTILSNLFLQQSEEGITHLMFPQGLRAFSVKAPDGEHIVIKIPAATSADQPQYLMARPIAPAQQSLQPVAASPEGTYDEPSKTI